MALNRAVAGFVSSFLSSILSELREHRGINWGKAFILGAAGAGMSKFGDWLLNKLGSGVLKGATFFEKEGDKLEDAFVGTSFGSFSDGLGEVAYK